MCLSNIEVIGQSMAEIQLLEKTKRVSKFKSGSRDPAPYPI